MFHMGLIVAVIVLKSEPTKHIELYEGILAQLMDVDPGKSVDVVISKLFNQMIKQFTFCS